MNSRLKPLALLGLLLIVLLLQPTQPSIAAANLTYGSPVTGHITDVAPTESWALTVKGSDRISVHVERTDGTLIPNVVVQDANGRTIAKADQDDTGAEADVDKATLHGAGTYQVVVGRFEGASGKTTGGYKLTVALLGAGPETPGLLDQILTGTINVNFSGELTNQKWADLQRIHFSSSDQIDVKVQRTDGSLIPTLSLIGPDKKIVKFADADDTKSQAEFVATLPAPGDYIFEVARAGNADGDTAGKYQASVHVVSTGADASVLGALEGQVQLEKDRPGDLNNLRWEDTWVVAFDKADTWTLIAARCGGTLIPELKILDANHKLLQKSKLDDTLTTATIANYRVPAPGQYFVVVTRDGEVSGRTTGSYDLFITQHAAAHTQPVCSNG